MRWRLFAASPSFRIGLGLAVGQGLIYATLPLVTRLFSPQQMGTAGTFMAAAAIVSSVATLRLETRLPTASPAAEVWLVRRARGSLAVVSLFALVAYWVITQHGFAASVFFSSAVVGLGGTALTMQVAMRRQAFGGIPVAKAAQGLGQVVVQLATGIGGMTRTGLQAGFAAGYILSTAVQGLFLRRNSVRAQDHESIPRSASRAYWRQAALLSVAAMLNAVAIWVYPLVTSAFFETSDTGQLTVAMRVVTIPTSLVIATFAPVVISAVGSSIRSGKDAAPVIRHYAKPLSILGVATLAVSYSFPREWIESLFGDQWGDARFYLMALAPASALQMVVGPLSLVLIAQGRARTQLLWDLSRTIVLVAVMVLVAGVFSDPVLTVVAGAAVVALFYILYLWLIFRKTTSSV